MSYVVVVNWAEGYRVFGPYQTFAKADAEYRRIYDAVEKIHDEQSGDHRFEVHCEGIYDTEQFKVRSFLQELREYVQIEET